MPLGSNGRYVKKNDRCAADGCTLRSDVKVKFRSPRNMLPYCMEHGIRQFKANKKAFYMKKL